jgi:hypothetical protein
VPNMMPTPPRPISQHWINTMRRNGEFPPAANDTTMGVVR